MVVLMNCCDYCGDLVELTEECYICNYDLCRNDIEPVLTGQDSDFVMVCNLCTVRFYQKEQIESYS